ncbi:hypothetical protein H8E07_17775 [bacterium]|nr:hypothetical protein [bacterium]
MMHRKTYAAILTITMLFGLVGCTDESAPVVAVSQEDVQGVTDGIAFVDETILVTDGGHTVKIAPGLADGEIVYSYGDFHISTNIETLTLSEWNDTDQLTVEMDFVGDNHLIETYNLNGHVMTVEHDGRPNAEALPGFVAFYEEHQTTLSDDREGWILNSVLGAKQNALIAAVDLQPHRLDDDPDKRPGWATVICGLAMLCAGIKCWFGFIANPWCVGCSGAVMACTIIEWFGWW